MSSKIEQAIEDIEQYIDTCKYQRFSSENILVNKDQIEELISELRKKTPDEIKRYQKVINNKEAILADAQAKADQIIAQAQIQTSELVSEHQIMQQAYAKANEVVLAASKEAQNYLDNAQTEANSIRMSAMDYLDGQLAGIEVLLTKSIETTKSYYDGLLKSLSAYLDIVTKNREQLVPVEETVEQVEQQSIDDPDVTSLSFSNNAEDN